MIVNQDEIKEVEKIVVKYKDGTEREVLKGLVITNKVEENEAKMTLEFADTTGKELSNILVGLIDMIVELAEN